MSDPPEVALYDPVKRFLEAQGYEVKGEVGAVDVMAVRGDEPPVLIELKTRFTLDLVHQGIARQAISDAVYLAVQHRAGRRAYAKMRQHCKLCRRLGLGLITVRPRDGHIEVLADPAPYRPRKSRIRLERLLREFQKRSGDPTQGGSTRSGLITAYRQDALRIAAALKSSGPCKGAVVARATGVGKATRIMADNHYGWFERVEIGIYALSPQGETALDHYAPVPARASEEPAVE